MTLSAASTIDSSNNGGSANGAGINIGSITGGSNNLTLISRASATTVSGNATGLATLTLQDDNAASTGSMIFNGNLSATTLTTVARGYATQFNGTTTAITNDVTFLNTGAITLGNGNDTLTFTGGLDTTAGSATNIGGTVRTAGQQIDLGAVTLSAASTIDSSNNGGNPNGAGINVGAINGNYALTLNAGSGLSAGEIVLGHVGSDTPLSSFSASGSSLSAQQIHTQGSGGIDLSQVGSSFLYGDVSARGGGGFVANDVVLGNSIVIDTRSLDANPAGDVRIQGVINGNSKGLSLNAGTGRIYLDGVAGIGDLQPLSSLTATASTLSASGIRTTGNLDLSGVTTSTLSGSYTTSSGSISTAALILGADVTMTAVGTSKNITVGAITGGTHALSLTASGNAITIGAATGLTTLTATGSTISTQAITSSGNIDFSGVSTSTLNGDISTTANGNITMAAVTIDTGLTMTAAGAGDISLGAINSQTAETNSLTLTATGDDITVGVIGGTTGLSSLTIAGAAVSLYDIGDSDTVGVSGATSVTATGAITFTGSIYKTNAATFTAGTNFNMNAGATTTFTTTNDAISFVTGTVQLANGSDLVVTSGGGAISIGAIRGTSSEDVTLSSTGGTTNTVAVGAIGNADEINTVAITGGTSITLNGNITTSDASGNTVTLTGPVILGAGITIDTDNTTNDGNISFSSTINGAQDLTLNAGTGTVTFNGVVGETPLSSLSTEGTTGGVSISNNITTTGAITLTGPLSVTGNSTIGGTTNQITIGSATLSDGVTLTLGTGGSTTINTGAISGTASGTASNITINTTGVVTIGGAVGTDIGTVTISGSNVSTQAMTTSGNIAITSTTFTNSGAINSAGTFTLINSGTATISNNILAGTTLTLNGSGTVNLGADLTTTNGAITTNDLTLTGSSATRTLTAGGLSANISTGAITGGSNALVLDATADAIMLGEASGLSSFTATSNTLTGHGITTTGNIDLSNVGTSTLSGSYTTSSGSISLNNLLVGVNLSPSATLTAGGSGNITIQGTTNSSDGMTSALTLSATGGTVTLNAMGQTRGLGATSITGASVVLNGSINLGDVSGNNFTVSGPVTLASNITINTDNTTNDGNISFSGSMNGAKTLDLNAGTGTVALGGAIGGSSRLTDLDVTAATTTLAGNVNLAAEASMTISGHLRILDHVTIDTNPNTSGSSTSGSVTIGGALSAESTGLTLSIDTSLASGTGGNISIGAVSDLGGTLISTLTLNAQGSTGHKGSITLNGDVSTAGAFSLTGGSLYIPNGGTLGASEISINAALSLPGQAITLSTSTANGNISLSGGSAGISSALNLTAGMGTVTIGGENYLGLGNVTVTAGDFTNSVNIHSTQFTLTNSGAATINGNISGSTGIVLNGAGAVNLGANLSASNGSISTGAMTLTGTSQTRTLTALGSSSDISIGAITGAGNAFVLNASGAISMTGAASGLSSFTATSNTLTGRGITTTGNIDLSNVGTSTLSGSYTTSSGSISLNNLLVGVNLSPSATLTAGGSGNITIQGTTNSSDGMTSALTLSATGGTVTLNAMGQTRGLGATSLTGASVVLNGNISLGDVSGNTLTVTGPVTLGDNITINTNNTTNDGNISFSGSINGANTLDLNAGTGTITLSGAVGHSTALSSLSLTGATIVGSGGVTATGSITFNGTPTLSGTFIANTISTAGDIALGGATVLKGDTVTLGGVVTGSARLTILPKTIGADMTLDTAGGTLNYGSTAFSGFTGDLWLGALYNGTTAVSGDVTFTAGLTSAGNIYAIAGKGLQLDGQVRSTAGNVTMVAVNGNIIGSGSGTHMSGTAIQLGASGYLGNSGQTLNVTGSSVQAWQGQNPLYLNYPAGLVLNNTPGTTVLQFIPNASGSNANSNASYREAAMQAYAESASESQYRRLKSGFLQTLASCPSLNIHALLSGSGEGEVTCSTDQNGSRVCAIQTNFDGGSGDC